MAFETSSGDDSDPVAQINVVPLVDIMLVLLVIFMVTAPMLQQGVEVNLPKVSTSGLATKEEQLVLSIDRQGKVFLGSGNEVAIEEVGKKVAAALKVRSSEDQKVFLKGDSSVDYGRMMAVMASLHQAGVTQIGLVSAPPEK